MTPDPLPENVCAAMRSGRKLYAIKLLRNATGISLPQALALVERHGSKAQADPRSKGADLSLPVAVRGAMDHGQKIDAIRLLHDQSTLGLKEAKDAVEAYADAKPANGAGLAPGEVPVTGSAPKVWIVVALVVVALLLYRLWF